MMHRSLCILTYPSSFNGLALCYCHNNSLCCKDYVHGCYRSNNILLGAFAVGEGKSYAAPCPCPYQDNNRYNSSGLGNCQIRYFEVILLIHSRRLKKCQIIILNRNSKFEKINMQCKVHFLEITILHSDYF